MIPRLLATWDALSVTPVLWLTFTLMAYIAALWLYRRCDSNPLLLPVLTAVIVVVGALLLTGTPYPVYEQGTELLIFFIGPATVALAVPLYGQLPQLKRMWKPVCVALLAGSVTAIVSSVGIAWVLGASLETMLSLAPKSATTPIAMEVTRVVGGLPSFATVAVAITGISGAIMTSWLLALVGIKDPVVKGFTLGLTAHAIGTARAFQFGERAGASSALAMSLNGILTAILVPILLALAGLFHFG
ncbi:LrgB family protein [Eoetvoesiella caeni]